MPSDGVWQTECWLKLDAYDIVSIGNTEIATELVSALEKSDESYDALLGAAKVQQELSQIRQDMLEQERQAHTMDNWFYRIFIALGLLAVGATQ
jgi:hypothetical protein